MPFHSKEMLEHWVAEFAAARGAGRGIRVTIQEGVDGADTGLVVVPLTSATNTVFIEPRQSGDDLTWLVTIEPAQAPTVLTSMELNALSHELQIAAELCSYLQEKSLGHFDFGTAAAPPAPGGASPDSGDA